MAHTFLYRRRRALLTTCVLLWLTAFAVTHTPSSELPHFSVGDKTLHVVGFFGLGGIFILTLVAYRMATLRRIVLVALAMMIYAGLDELTQPYFGRTADLLDWVSDMGGTTLAIILCESTFALFLKKTT